MPCETMNLKGQTLGERKIEVRKAAKMIDKLIAARKVQIKVGPQGAIVFTGIPAADRSRMTDACIYRRIMATGSVQARMALARAEQMAGRSVDRKVVAQGTHSHDGGRTWGPRG